MNITEDIRQLCDELGFYYSQETPSAENVRQDKIKQKIVLWRNIVEDGNIEENKNGLYCVRRHYQFGIYEDCKLGEKGDILNDQKERLLGLMLKFYRKLSDRVTNKHNWEPYQPASFQVGYDKNDANKAFCLLDAYFKSPFQNDCV